MLKLFILLVISICLFEGIPLAKKKSWKTMIAFGSLMGIALFISIGKALGLPTPIELLDQWLRPVGEAIFK